MIEIFGGGMGSFLINGILKKVFCVEIYNKKTQMKYILLADKAETFLRKWKQF